MRTAPRSPLLLALAAAHLLACGGPTPKAAPSPPVVVGEGDRLAPGPAARPTADEAPREAPVASELREPSPLPALTFDDAAIEPSALAASERRTYDATLARALSPCSDPYTLGVCLRDQRACKLCGPAAAIVARGARDGEDEKTLADYLDRRFSPAAKVSLDVGQSPVLGRAEAPITVVAFLDLECPHCAVATPVLEAVVAAHPDVRLVVKHFPLVATHPHAASLARAATAAHLQGRFFPMLDRLMANQGDVDDAKIERVAARVAGLDLARWKADWRSPAVAARVDADAQLANALRVDGTPTIYVDGRPFHSLGSGGYDAQLHRWILVERAIQGR